MMTQFTEDYDNICIYIWNVYVIKFNSLTHITQPQWQANTIADNDQISLHAALLSHNGLTIFGLAISLSVKFQYCNGCQVGLLWSFEGSCEGNEVPG